MYPRNQTSPWGVLEAVGVTEQGPDTKGTQNHGPYARHLWLKRCYCCTSDLRVRFCVIVFALPQRSAQVFVLAPSIQHADTGFSASSG